MLRMCAVSLMKKPSFLILAGNSGSLGKLPSRRLNMVDSEVIETDEDLGR